jgi:hypothetical protein
MPMKLFTYFLLPFLLFTSCIKNNPDPAWIEISAWDLQSNPNAQYPQGELTQNFTDAWIYIDEKVIGVFELPVKLPILMEGNKKIQIFPTVRNNGISATKKIYPFCTSYTIYANLEKNKTLSIHPTTQYFEQTKFWIEDFEDAAIKIETSTDSNAEMEVENNPEFLEYGNFYGHIALNSSNDSLWTGVTIGQMVLPKASAEVYLEIDYMNTNDMLTGVLAYSTSNGTVTPNPYIQLNAQNPSEMHWKKIYIDLKEIVSGSITASYFRMYFQSLINAGASTGDVYIDNIKVVHL